MTFGGRELKAGGLQAEGYRQRVAGRGGEDRRVMQRAKAEG